MLRLVIEEFERRCRKYNIVVDTTEHIQGLLRREEIFDDHYVGLANKLRNGAL